MQLTGRQAQLSEAAKRGFGEGHTIAIALVETHQFTNTLDAIGAMEPTSLQTYKVVPASAMEHHLVWWFIIVSNGV